MKLVLALLVALIGADSVVNNDPEAAAGEYYNLLTIDGGGIRGLIPTMVLQQMETYSWQYATTKGYEFPQYEGHEGHFALKDIFDMMAGTSTGSILAAGLAYPDVNNTKLENQNINTKYKQDEVFIMPGFYAADLIKIYSTEAGRIFVWRTLGWVLPVSIVFSLLIMGAIGYKLGVHFYDNEKTKASFKELRQAISNAKKESKMEEPKYKIANSDSNLVDNVDKKANMDKFLGSKLLSMVDAKKQEILSQQTVDVLNAQPKLKGIDMILKAGIMNHISETNASLLQAERDYNKGKPKKWVVFIFFLVLGGLGGWGIPKLDLMLSSSKFSRSSLDDYMHEQFGAKYSPDMITNELMVISYEYNSQEPRFFSKYMTQQNAKIYNMSIGNQTASSSAAPTFFNPHEVINGYNLTELQIDGGTICNNPTLYAYELSRQMYGHMKTRVVSLGTGQLPFTPVVPKDFTTATRLAMHGNFMMDFDAYSADYWTRYTIGDYKKNYVRAQIVSSLSMDDDSDKAIIALKAAGEGMWTKFKDEIEPILREIIDQKYGPKSAQ